MGMGAMLPSWEHSAPYAWERPPSRMGAVLPCHGSGAPMAWEQVQNVGEALPWGADMGALLDPLPCMGGGGSHDMGAGRNFWVSR